MRGLECSYADLQHIPETKLEVFKAFFAGESQGIRLKQHADAESSKVMARQRRG